MQLQFGRVNVLPMDSWRVISLISSIFYIGCRQVFLLTENEIIWEYFEVFETISFLGNWKSSQNHICYCVGELYSFLLSIPIETSAVGCPFLDSNF